METPDATSQEKLDRMLRDGVIAEDDYRRLSSAMAPAPKLDDAGEIGAAERPKLRKNWENGLIGGLCAGLAEHFGADANVVRIGAVVAFVVLTALGGVGLAAIPLYFGLCGLVPWDETEKAEAFRKSGRPGLFMLAAASLLFVLPLAYSALILPGVESVYEEMGVQVWSPQFQGTLAGRAIDSASEYRGLARQAFSPEFGHVTMFVLMCALAALFTLLLGVIQASLCKARVRKCYAIAVLSLGALWCLFLVCGSLYPMLKMVERVS